MNEDIKYFIKDCEIVNGLIAVTLKDLRNIYTFAYVQGAEHRVPSE